MDIKVYEGKNQNVFKYVFSTKEGVSEAVLYRYPTFNDRTVICCSVSSGCPVGCTFCGTGKRFIKNLTTSEIVFQPQYIISSRNINTAGVKRLQIMFMSMGEPMLNWKSTKAAICELHKKYNNAELLISTIGIYDHEVLKDIIEVSKNILNLGLQLSIHEYSDVRRNKIIPFQGKMNLEQIADFGRLWHTETGRFPFLNYIVTRENTKGEALSQLAKLFDPKIFKLTLSVLCETDKNKSTNINQNLNFINNFKKQAEETGFDVRVFNPAGQDDIGGGCGQLWYVQNRLREITS